MAKAIKTAKAGRKEVSRLKKSIRRVESRIKTLSKKPKKAKRRTVKRKAKRRTTKRKTTRRRR